MIHIIALWTAVGLNFGAAMNYFYWSHRYRRKIKELDDQLHEMQNLHAVMTEHTRVH